MRVNLRSTGAAVAAAFAIGFAWRVGLIEALPGNYSFDGLQRWAGREHVLVQDWLPALQLVVRACAWWGFHLSATRMTVGLLGAVAGALVVAFTGRLGGWRPAWAAVPFCVYGPFVCWTIVPYQEGIFLCALFGSLLAAANQRMRLADVLMGFVGLVRYEGWPFIVIWMMWRRDVGSLTCLWGVALWLGGKFGLHWVGARPSPIDIRDWEGMFGRFDLMKFVLNVVHHGKNILRSGGIVAIALAMVGVRRFHDRWRGLLLTWLAVQLLITAAWMIALEQAISRMLVVPAALIFPFAAVGAVALWDVAAGVHTGDDLPRRAHRFASRVGRRGVLAVPCGLFIVMAADGLWRVDRETEGTHWEKSAVGLMLRCPDCRWWVEPRQGFGPRLREDGCEAIQGVSSLRHGAHFYCAPWLSPEEADQVRPTTSSAVVWDEGRRTYRVFRKWDWAKGEPPTSTNAEASPEAHDANSGLE